MNLEDFKKIILEEKKAAESELSSFINEWLNKLPVPTVQVNQNTFIERAVVISKDSEEFDLNRLSYIPEDKKHYAKKGRFNNDNEPTFYAAFTDLEKPESTRYFLATELDHSLLKNQTKNFNITVTKWLSTESFPSIFFVFKDDYCTNSLTKSALEQFKNSDEFKKLTKDDIEFLELITDEFAKTESSNKYTVTNIVFDYFKEKGYQSIIYPGVRSRYRGNNIAMLPNVIDKNWTCCFGAEFAVNQHGDNISIDVKYKINLKQEKLVYSKFGKSEIGNETTIKK